MHHLLLQCICAQITSCVPTDYMSIQSDINHKMRAILIDWLIEVCNYQCLNSKISPSLPSVILSWTDGAVVFLIVQVHHKFELLPETLFLAINLIDRYLSRQHVMRKYLQLVGITGMLLACKYEEVCVPLLEDFVYIADRAYSKEDVLKMVTNALK